MIPKKEMLDMLYHASRTAAREYDEAWAEAEASRLRMVEKLHKLCAAQAAFCEANNAEFMSYKQG